MRGGGTSISGAGSASKDSTSSFTAVPPPTEYDTGNSIANDKQRRGQDRMRTNGRVLLLVTILTVITFLLSITSPTLIRGRRQTHLTGTSIPPHDEDDVRDDEGVVKELLS